jgi:magnesium-transporting ATPase (P-type)
MKTTIFKNLFYLIALGYVFLGVFFLDWSLRMVPFGKDALWYDIVVTVVINICFIAIGVLLYIATFLAVRMRKIASIIYDLSFWIGVTVFSMVAVLLMTLVVFHKATPDHIGDIVMYCLLYVPFMLVYLNRKKMEKYSQ